MKIVLNIKTKDLKTKKYHSYTIEMFMSQYKSISRSRDRRKFIKEFLDSKFTNYTIISTRVEK